MIDPTAHDAVTDGLPRPHHTLAGTDTHPCPAASRGKSAHARICLKYIAVRPVSGADSLLTEHHPIWTK